MFLLPLASEADAASYGLTATYEALQDASQRVREYTRQDFTAGPHTVQGRGERLRLPRRPVASVTAVRDDDGRALPSDAYRLRPGGWLEVPRHTGWIEVDYVCTGEVPAGVARVVCQVAARIISQPAALQAGAQQQSAGPFQQTYGWDSYVGASGLTAGERRALDRICPRAGGPVVMRPA